jgi:hypothetical protein
MTSGWFFQGHVLALLLIGLTLSWFAVAAKQHNHTESDSRKVERHGSLGGFIVDLVIDILDTPTPAKHLAHIMDTIASARSKDARHET